jgi:arginyl-tRNA synthetase
MLGLSLYLAGREAILGEDVEYPEVYYRGEYIIDLAKEIASEQSIDIFKDESNIEMLSTIGKDKMLELIKSNLADTNIYFDNFVSEKSLYDRWDAIESKLNSNSALYMKDGKLWLKSTEHKDEKDRVVVRETKEPTYLAGDIIYHDDKFQRGFDKYINIWGADHHGYLTRVKSAIKFLGYDDSKLDVLFTQMVSLLKNGEPYKMSKRAGNFILMADIIEEIGSDALRFVFLSKRCDTHLEFDIDELKREDSSNPIYYINYANARINSIFEKANKSFDDVADVPLVDLSESEKDLLFLALRLPKVLEDSFEARAVNRVCEYLYDLASALHSFYNSNRVLESDREAIYLKIFATVSTSIKVALSLIGITAKERM